MYPPPGCAPRKQSRRSGLPTEFQPQVQPCAGHALRARVRPSRPPALREKTPAVAAKEARFQRAAEAAAQERAPGSSLDFAPPPGDSRGAPQAAWVKVFPESKYATAGGAGAPAWVPFQRAAPPAMHAAPQGWERWSPGPGC